MNFDVIIKIIKSKEMKHYLWKKCNNENHCREIDKIIRKLRDEESVDFNKVIKYFTNSNEKNILEMLTGICEYAVQNNYQKQLEETEHMINVIHYNINKYSLDILFFIEPVLFAVGDFLHANELRNIIESKMMQKYNRVKKIPPRLSVYFLRLYEEKGLHKEKEQLYQHIKKQLKGTGRDYFEFCYNYDEFAIREPLENKNDDIFLNMVRNKKVAIIGPAQGDEEMKNIRDEFDIIVQINYLGNPLYGIVPDVSCYNRALGLQEEKLKQEYMKDLKFMVFRLTDSLTQQKYVDDGIARVNNKIHDIFGGNGALNMIQLIVTDLLYFKPEQIKIFNTNFYLAKEIYSNDYCSEFQELKYNIWYPFARHNPIIQFEYTQMLYNCNRIDFDQIGTSVMNMNRDEYIKKLSKTHGIESLNTTI